MTSVITRYEAYCGSEPPKEDCACAPYYSPVCGCDGYNYRNPCEAFCEGIFDYFVGPCKNSTPIRLKSEE